MIEGLLKPGVVFSVSCPSGLFPSPLEVNTAPLGYAIGDVNSPAAVAALGDLVLNTGAAFTVTYHGINDAMLGVDGLALRARYHAYDVRKHNRSLGWRPGTVYTASTLRWLDYSKYRTSYAPMVAGTDFLTGQMSGCPIACTTDADPQWGGGPAVFHVGTVDGFTMNNTIKTNFGANVGAISPNLEAFNPINAVNIPSVDTLNRYGIAGAYCYAIVTQNRRFFSTLLGQLTNEKALRYRSLGGGTGWCVIDISQAPKRSWAVFAAGNYQ